MNTQEQTLVVEEVTFSGDALERIQISKPAWALLWLMRSYIFLMVLVLAHYLTSQ